MSFGHARLVSSDIAPTTESQRTLTPGQESGLWAAFGAAVALPYVWSATDGAGVVSVCVLAAVVCAVALGTWLTPTAAHYGIGTGIIARAAFGSDAAIVFHVVRYGVCVAWAAQLVQALAHWTALYIQAIAPTIAPLLELEWTASSRFVEGAACCGIGVLAGIVARGRVRRCRRTIRVVAFFASICVGCLIVFGIWRVPLSLEIVVGPSLPASELAKRALTLMLPIPVLAFAVPEWARYRGEHVRRGVLNRIPRVAINALVIALLVTEVTVASQVIRRRADFALVGDATGAFGIALGGTALLLAFFLTFAVVPLFGILNGSSAVCSAFPSLRYPWVARITGLIVGIVALVNQTPVWLIALAAPPLIILLIDEWLIRRRTAVLDSLYEPGALRISTLIACVAAWTIIVLYHETLIACGIAALGAVLPLATRIGFKRRAPQPPVPKHVEKEWSDSKKLEDADWSPDDVTRVK